MLETCGITNFDPSTKFNLAILNKSIQQTSISDFDTNLLTKNLTNNQNINFDSNKGSEDNYLQIFNEKVYSLGKIGRKKLNSRLGLSIPDSITRVTIDDVIAISNYLVDLHANLGELDDIDNLRNRRVRSIGELLQIQYGIGLSRLERSINERLMITNSTAFKVATIPVSAE